MLGLSSGFLRRFERDVDWCCKRTDRLDSGIGSLDQFDSELFLPSQNRVVRLAGLYTLGWKVLDLGKKASRDSLPDRMISPYPASKRLQQIEAVGQRLRSVPKSLADVRCLVISMSSLSDQRTSLLRS